MTYSPKMGDMSFEEWVEEHEEKEVKSETVNNQPIDNVKMTEYNMFRKDHNIGVFSELSEPMQQKHVERIIKDMGSDFSGIEIDIIRKKEYVGKGLFGFSFPNGKRIQLYPDAFSSREVLVKALGHERIHCEQVISFGKARNDNELLQYERAARFSEKYWWESYKERTGYV